MTTDQNPTPDPAPTSSSTPKASSSSDGRFAAFDNTYLRFVGGTHDTRKAATAAAKAAGVEDFEIREV